MIRAVLALLLALGLASAGAAADKKSEEGKKGDEGKTGKRPSLALRALPRFAFSPASVHFTAELTGGDDLEEFYCPDVEWEWGDGGKSQQESDCPPFEEGTRIERRFTADHVFQLAGRYTVKVTLRRAGKSVAAQTLQMTIRPGLGDRTLEPY